MTKMYEFLVRRQGEDSIGVGERALQGKSPGRVIGRLRRVVHKISAAIQV